jgi:hypothetical protein
MKRYVIAEVKKLQLKQLESINIVGRIWGEHDPEWQTTLKTKPKSKPKSTPTAKVSAQTKPEPAIASSPLANESATNADITTQPSGSENLEVADRQESSAKQEPQPEPESANLTKPGELSEFCFSRNKHLVAADLPHPDPEVADAVMFFHKLSEADKVFIAPILNDFFSDPKKTEISHLWPEWQEWLNKLKKLGNREFRSTSVWLSRYCLDRDRTLKQVNATLGIESEVKDLDSSENADRSDHLDRPHQSKPPVDISSGSFKTYRSEPKKEEAPADNNAMPEVGMAYQKQVLTDIKFTPKLRPTIGSTPARSKYSKGTKGTSSANRGNTSRSGSAKQSKNIDLQTIWGFLRRWRIVVSLLVFVFITVPLKYSSLLDLFPTNQAVNSASVGVSATPLHTAAGEGNLPAVQNLISLGADVNAPDQIGNTPLHQAVSGCPEFRYEDEEFYPTCSAKPAHVEIAALLITSGANPNVVNVNGETPLHWAAFHGSKETVEVLLSKGANVNAKNVYDETPLDYAEGSGDPLKVQFISDRGGVSGYQ